MPSAIVRKEHVAAAVRHATGLLEFGSRVGSEITALVQEVHAASSPLALLTSNLWPARPVYGGIRLGFHGAERLAALAGRLAAASLHRTPGSTCRAP
jgi:hypothetical protein